MIFGVDMLAERFGLERSVLGDDRVEKAELVDAG
jgi:hypothetical protein